MSAATSLAVVSFRMGEREAEANGRMAAAALAAALRAGVRLFCLCPGGRNAPWVELLDRLAATDTIEVINFFEERSAAFFALGRAKRDSRPVAICTTSGTAVAELLPAFVEARHSGVPLWALTADRPHRYRGSGAPQTIEQAGLLASEIDCLVDLDAQCGCEPHSGCSHPVPPRASQQLHQPGNSDRVHWNLSFDEPLLPRTEVLDAAVAELAQCVGSSRTNSAIPDRTNHPHPGPLPGGEGEKLAPLSAWDVSSAFSVTMARFLTGEAGRLPLVLIGGLRHAEDREAVARWVERLRAPVLAEASSHLRGDVRVKPWLLRGGEELAQSCLRQGHVTGVIRFGAIPSFRLWRDVELTRPRPPVISVNRLQFSGLSGAVDHHVVASIPPPAAAHRPCREGERVMHLLRHDGVHAERREQLRQELSASEPALLAALAQALPLDAFVYLGNSLPIREWTSDAAGRREAALCFDENRGANGIDGQLSSFLGGARWGRENIGIFGDLTMLYDLAAPWVLRALGDIAARIRFVIVHNGGGRIFESMFASPRFLNAHVTPCEPWARMWGLEYHLASTSAEVRRVVCGWNGSAAGPSLLEIRPDAEQTRHLREQWRAETSASSCHAIELE